MVEPGSLAMDREASSEEFKLLAADRSGTAARQCNTPGSAARPSAHQLHGLRECGDCSELLFLHL